MELVYGQKSISWSKVLSNFDIPELSDDNFLQHSPQPLSPWSLSCSLFWFSSLTSRSFFHEWLCIGTIHSPTPAILEKCTELLGLYPFPHWQRGHWALFGSVIVAHEVEVLGEMRLREVGEKRNPNSHAEGESSANLISCSWPHSLAATCCQKHGFENSNRCWAETICMDQQSLLLAGIYVNG